MGLTPPRRSKMPCWPMNSPSCCMWLPEDHTLAQGWARLTGKLAGAGVWRLPDLLIVVVHSIGWNGIYVGLVEVRVSSRTARRVRSLCMM